MIIWALSGDLWTTLLRRMSLYVVILFLYWLVSYLSSMIYSRTLTPISFVLFVSGAFSPQKSDSDRHMELTGFFPTDQKGTSSFTVLHAPNQDSILMKDKHRSHNGRGIVFAYHDDPLLINSSQAPSSSSTDVGWQLPAQPNEEEF